MEKRFSIIISAYNIEDYIKRAIKSVLEQDFKNYELIVIDDKSVDSTLEKIKEINDERIIVIANPENK